MLQKPDVAGRMVRWVVELSEFDILYEPRGSIKGQGYADFAAELSPGSAQQEEEVGSQWVDPRINKGVEPVWSWRGQTVC